MSREEIDAAIKRHADFEMLYDKPYEDKKKVRVTGPFTVESLSPAPLAGLRRPGDPTSERDRARRPPTDPDAADVRADRSSTTSRKAGVQNGRRAERLEFAVVEPYAGTYIQAVGDREDGDRGRGAEAGRHRDRPAVRHGRPAVRQGRRPRGDRARRTSTCCACSPSPSTPQALGDRADGRHVDARRRASPTSRPSARSAASRCCWSA